MTNPAAKERLVVEFAPAEGAVIRMLGLVERRGFEMVSVDMVQQPCGLRASMGMDVVARDPGRRTELLALQLRRLHGVSGVTIEACQREKAA